MTPHIIRDRAGAIRPNLSMCIEAPARHKWSFPVIAAFSLTLGKRKGLGPPSASREDGLRQSQAAAHFNWVCVVRPLGSHRTRSRFSYGLLRRVSRYSPVLVLAGSGKGVAGLSFGFLKGQCGSISGLTHLVLVDAPRPVWSCETLTGMALHQGRCCTAVLGHCFLAAHPHITQRLRSRSAKQKVCMYVCMYACMYVCMYVM